MRRLLSFISGFLMSLVAVLVICALCVRLAFGDLLGFASEGTIKQLTKGVDGLSAAVGGATRRLTGTVPIEQALAYYQDEMDVLEVHGLWHESLSDAQKVLYDDILVHLGAKEETFAVDSTSPDDVKAAYEAIQGDHPEIFWIGGYSYVAYEDEMEITPELLVPVDEIEQRQQAIDAVVAEVFADLPDGASDYDVVCRAYEWIIGHTSYVDGENDQTIESVFLGGESVCAGYSRAFQYLMHERGIRCAYIAGDAQERGSHAWNIVWIDGNPTCVDVTWGDPLFMSEDGTFAPEDIAYDYLCVTSEEMARTRTAQLPMNLPSCDVTDYDYYRRNGWFFDWFSPDTLNDLLWQAADQGKKAIRIKFASYEVYQEALDYVATGGLYNSEVLANVEELYYGGNDALYILAIEW